MDSRERAVITGASSGIGLELARCAAEDGYDLLLCADEAEVDAAAAAVRRPGIDVQTVLADLSTDEGIERLWSAMIARPFSCFCANAGRGLGHGFLDQAWGDVEAVIQTNVTGSSVLLQRAARRMVEQGGGRILVTGSVAGLVPGSFQAVYNATKAYLDTLSWGMREELKDHGVSVTCLMPGPTDTEFFERAGMQDTPLGSDDGKDDPAEVARQGWQAMRKGRSGVTTGFTNKVQAAFSGIVPDEMLARLHRRAAEPEGDGSND